MRFSFSLSLKNDVERVQIMVRITLTRTSQFRVKSRLFISPKHFKDGQIVIPRIRIPEFNQIVDTARNLNNLQTYLTDILLDPKNNIRSSHDLQVYVDRFFIPEDTAEKIDPNGVDFWSAWNLWESQTKVSQLRMRRYKVVRLDLERYEDYIKKPLTLDISAEDILAFENFLRNEHTWSKNASQRGDNVLKSLIGVLRTFVNWCLNTGLITKNPFKLYRMPKEVYGTPVYLTLQERDTIADTDYHNDHLNEQRDVFIFQCLVGCRVGDLLKLTADNIVDGVLEYTPHKTMGSTGTAVQVPLNDRAMSIVRRYGAKSTEKLLPFISSQRYNDAIKTLFIRAGIDRMVTTINSVTKQEERKPLYAVASSHIARRTFIGNLYQQVQAPNLIGSMLGHAEGSRAFSRYRKIDIDVKKKIVDLIK